ncbi:hypothetical protein L7F22_049492 [Adiantum nelumboides]|nr:hypothetical protein [Adiantum nelumboides]
MRKSEAAKSSADKHDADEGKSSNLTTSASNRHFAIYDVKGAKPQIRNIFDACERGDHRAIMSFAKDKDFDIDAKDRFGRTALIWAADCGHLHICESLIRLNANINTTDLHTGRYTTLSGTSLLVQYGANINKEDKYGLTPLYLAKSRGPDGEEVFQYLLAEGAPYNELKTFRISAIEDQIRAEMAALEAATAAEASKTQ